MDFPHPLGPFSGVQVLAPSLFAATRGGRTFLVRTGPSDACERASRVLQHQGLRSEIHAIDEERSVVGVPQEGRTTLELGASTVQVHFARLAGLVASLHRVGLRLGRLDPAGHLLEPFLVFPPCEADPIWTAPEGPGRDAADWYVVGRLLFQALSGTILREHTNGPDPREWRPAASGELAALTMDLLLLDPASRPSEEEILEALAVPPAQEEAAADWLPAALARGGLEHRDLVPNEVGGLMPLGPEHLEATLDHLRQAGALTMAQRLLVASLLQSGETLSEAAVDRASRLLGMVLAAPGPGAVWITSPTGVWPRIVEGLLRADPAPLVVVSGVMPIALVERCKAARVPGLEPMEAEALPRAESEPLFATGEVTATLEELEVLGVPVGGGLGGRMRAWWDNALSRGSAPPRPVDVGLNRAVMGFALPLGLLRPELGEGIGWWLLRRAHQVGDVDGSHSARVLLLGQGQSPQDHVSEAGEAWRLLAEVLALRAAGRFSVVELRLRTTLPLAGGDASCNHLATFLLAEAMMARGGFSGAARILRFQQIDARASGNQLAEIAALALLVRLGAEAGGLERACAGVDLGSGALLMLVETARGVQALSEGLGPKALEHFRAAAAPAQVWPLQRGAWAVESQVLVDRLAVWLEGAAPPPVPDHPLGPAWSALLAASTARLGRDLVAAAGHLKVAGLAFDAEGHLLHAAACMYYRGQFVAGSAGGNLVDAACRRFRGAGVHDIPSQAARLIPEMGLARPRFIV